LGNFGGWDVVFWGKNGGGGGVNMGCLGKMEGVKFRICVNQKRCAL